MAPPDVARPHVAPPDVDALAVPTPAGRPPGRPPVDRPRLQAALDDGRDARLLLVAAPAGFGKSTLLSAWLGTADVRWAWTTLEPRDNDPVRFARRVAAAADVVAGRGEDRTAVDPAQRFVPELALDRILDPLVSASHARTDGGVVLVLDDYHVVTEPAIHGLVADLIGHLPAGARLAIATRADPPLPLARLRAHGELLELRAEDLRFTTSEAGELLRSATVELSDADVEALTARTEGWAAVLRLAAVSLRDRPDRADAVRRFGASHRFVLDYIVEEVLVGLPPETQGFLLRTAILNRLSGPLCEAVSGLSDGQRRLEELEHANLLILPLDDERRWYRYHSLFAEVLRARLRMEQPGEIPGLHARAAAWLAEHGDDDAAIGHAILAGDRETAGRLVAAASLRGLNAGEIGTVRRWLDALPDDVVRHDPQLSVSYAWCLALAGEPDGLYERLADAELALAGAHPDVPFGDASIGPQVAMIRSRLADLEGDPATAVEQARLACETVPPGLPPRAAVTFRGDATVLLARALVIAGDIEGATVAYEASLPDLREGGNVLAVGRAIGDLAMIALHRGDPSAAIRLCEAEIERGPDGTSASASPAVWLALARAREDQGEVERAASAAHRAVELAVRAGDAQVARSAHATLARLEPVLARRRSDAPGDAASAVAHPAGLVEPLTPRELEVLRLVALGRSNTAIAADLFVTVGTVKSHVHAISGKLGAANRVEAVARARDLGILP